MSLESSQERIADRLRASDEAAFDALFRELFKPLVAYSFRYLESKESSKDIVQDVFVKLWDIRETLDSERSVHSLLYTMVRNSSLNLLKKKRPADLGSVPEPVHHSEADEDTKPDELPSLIIESVSKLPLRQREAFEMSRFEGLSHEDIALKMQCAPRTVNNHIMAALKNLRTLLEPHLHKFSQS